MLGTVKKKITSMQLKRCEKNYTANLQKQKNRYEMWIGEHETDLSGKACRVQSYIQLQGSHRVMSFTQFEQLLQGKIQLEETSGVLVLASEDGLMAAEAVRLLCAFLDANQEYSLVYADEDRIYDNQEVPAGKSCVITPQERFLPWFKPGFSPDTLLSFFYMGNILALRIEYVQHILAENGKIRYLYEFMLHYTEAFRKTGHLPKVLFHHFTSQKLTPECVEENEWQMIGDTTEKYGYEPEFAGMKEAFLLRNQIEGHMENALDLEGKELGFQVVRYTLRTKPLVSVIIPTKDHPEVLETCLSSFVTLTEYSNVEFIVVDNGSTPENRKKMELLQERFGFLYHYEPMTFNFSKMSNLGAGLSKGDYLLFLNDDMEIVQKDWLTILLGQAMQERCGAVGAKLLYPQTKEIQHVGITNMAVGPSHKLIHLPQGKDYYYGHNLLPYNVIGVTAACLLINREKYEAAGGFPEDIQIAYNDADFCMSVYECDYFNVVRNDVVLLHHESLSRGDDRLDDEKLKRLLQEKEMVRMRHERNMEKDPFYSENLAGYRVDYLCSYQYPYEKRQIHNKVKKSGMKNPAKWENNCLMVYLDACEVEQVTDIKDQAKNVLIEGWSYVLGMDNCRYERSILLLKDEETVLRIPVMDRYRKDADEILPQEKNTALAGFVCRVPIEQFPKGTYTLAMLAKDKCSRQYLYKEIAGVKIHEQNFERIWEPETVDC